MESIQVESNINIELRNDGEGVVTPLNPKNAGLSKEELMKYANQPFWIRLRNILFATFWIVWVSILVAAIGYVVNSPSCAHLASASAVPSNSSTVAP